MKKLIGLASAFLAFCTAAHAVSFNIAVDGLRDQNGQFVAQNSLVLIVLDTTGTGFKTPLADFTVAQGAEIADGNKIAFIGNLDGGGAGAFFDTVVISSTEGNNVPIAIYWFPDALDSSNIVTAGSSYGYYTTTDASQFYSTAAWNTGTTPTGIYDLNVIAQNNTAILSGQTPWPNGLADALLTANLTTVPEPASASALLTMTALLVALRRKRA